jgi:valyl-tRNA synthetase
VITGTGTAFDGMDRFEARVAVREALREQGRIVAEKRPYLHSVGHSSRAPFEPVEPRLSLQWFVDVGPLARAAGDAVRDGRVAVHPPEMESRWFGWVDNMHDWCISRQLWWGHRIPVWYGPAGEVVCLGPDDPAPGEGWTQDEDVLDTWFSSGLWPFSTLGWPDETPDLQKFYPTSVLVTGYDILFFWVARMMMFGLYAMGDRKPDDAIPFHTIALHGMVRDEHGRKMSKSAGNSVDPIEWMDRYGTDAVRFTLARGANPGVDVPVGVKSVENARNFASKLWNATRFAMANGADANAPLPAPEERTAADRWILGRLGQVNAQVDALLDDYQFAKAVDALFHFTWDEVCDWYIELAKPQFVVGPAEGTRAVLGHVLDAVLRLLHPVMPFVTETLWKALTGGETLVVASWPVEAGAPIDAAAATGVADVQKLTTEIRRFRAEQGLPDRRSVAGVLRGLDAAGLAPLEHLVRTLTRLDEPGAEFAANATLEVVTAGGTVYVELDTSGAIDVEAERARLDRDLAAARKELDQTTAKLGNPKFTERAPADVVDGIRARQQAAQAEVERITAWQATLSG